MFIWDLSHFFASLSWPVTRKWLIFRVWFRFWGPAFFQFPIGLPIFTFIFVLDFFGKTPYLRTSVVPVLLRILRGQKKISYGKTVANLISIKGYFMAGENVSCKSREKSKLLHLFSFIRKQVFEKKTLQWSLIFQRRNEHCNVIEVIPFYKKMFVCVRACSRARACVMFFPVM